ncbi:MAG: C40 family peptidase [Flavobacterium sp.]|nr:C40 family peptidase [Flavobacterium sp.]
MSFKQNLILFLISVSSLVFSQERLQHTVVKGETVYSLAHKYQVKQSDILEMNPKAKNGLKLDMVLQIPNKNQPIIAAEPIVHEVLPKETLYGISKKYNVSIDKIKEANSFIETEGLKIGAKVSIPSVVQSKVVATSKKEIKEVQKEAPKKIEIATKIEPKVNVDSATEEITHEVLAKETKYGISKKYGITIAELEALNPTIKSGLDVGYKLVVKNGTKKTATNTEEKKSVKIEDKVVAEREVEKPKSQFKIIGRVESDKNEEIGQVKPQMEETDDEVVEIEPVVPIEEVAPLSPENISKAEFLIAKASENLGARYRSGATGNGGFDCSGLMYTTFKNIEMTLPRSSRDMAANAGVRIDKSQAQKGDLIFFATSGRGVSHVGMVTEVSDDEIKFIHSSTSSGVIVSSTKEAYYAKRFVQVNRVLEN